LLILFRRHRIIRCEQQLGGPAHQIPQIFVLPAYVIEDIFRRLILKAAIPQDSIPVINSWTRLLQAVGTHTHFLSSAARPMIELSMPTGT
jgi:hypothetical protein